MSQATWWSRMMLGVCLGSAAMTAMAGCGDELPLSSDASAGANPSGRPVDPRLQLQGLAQEAVKRSARLGAIKLQAQASSYDLDEVRGAAMPQVSINGSLGPANTVYKNQVDSKGTQITGGVNVTGMLYDGGRLSSLTKWREELLKSAQANTQSTRDQVAMEAIGTAVERNRYKVQANVFHQQARKMSCLVEVLEQIVAEDKGRSSELVQARKTQAQAELSRDSALAMSRQLELRLRKMVGDQVPPTDGLGIPLGETMDRGEVLRLMGHHPDLMQLRTQADAAEQLASSVSAKGKPQLNWMASGSGSSRGETKSVSVQAGVSVSWSIYSGGADQAAAMAASKRAESARQQYEEFARTLNSRVLEVFDAASSAQERAKKYVDVLKDSDRVRTSTFQQWSQLGRRSLFDVMSAESDHFNLRIAYVNALHDAYQANAQLRALGGGLSGWLGLPD
jgi:outer membrane protein, adhesin transport system